MRNNSLSRKIGWLLVLGFCTSAAWAHHGGGTFDANKCFVFKGAGGVPRITLITNNTAEN